MSFARTLLSVILLALCASLAHAQAVTKEYLKTLPPAEQAMKDEVDHWGLPFADQLRRFIAGRDAFRAQLGNQAVNGFVVGIQHGLDKVSANKYWFKGAYTNSVALSAARNEYENVQVAVLPDIGKTLTGVTLSATALQRVRGDGSIPAENVRIYRVGYVQPVAARYPALHRRPWPDPLLPNAPVDIAGTDLGLFWVEIKTPKDAPAGDYRGKVAVKAGDESLDIAVALHVHDFALPDRVPFPIAVWTSPRWPWNKAMTPEEYRALLAEFLRHGVDPVSVGRSFVSVKKNDFAVLDENLAFALERGLQLFELPRGKPEALKPLVEHLRKKGWMDKAIVYSNRDEPDRETFIAQNVPHCRTVHTLYPGLRVFLASEYHPNIDQGCDIWLTDVSTGRGADFARRNKGTAQLWFYYCHLPVRIDFHRPLVQAPNMQIDNEAIEHRLTLWLAWKYETDGMFIWAGNNEWRKKDVDRTDWRTKGWQLSAKPYGFPYGGVHNGNGYLIYPGPLPSVRLKVLRDGLEDYGYLQELRKRLKQRASNDTAREAAELLAVPYSVLVDPHYFNRDPCALLQARARIAELIEALGD